MEYGCVLSSLLGDSAARRFGWLFLTDACHKVTVTRVTDVKELGYEVTRHF